MQAWTGDKPLRLVMHTAERDDPEPSARGRSDSEAGQAAGLAGALACYGLWLPARARMLLRFVEGRPVSTVTCAFLAWAAERLAAEGVRVLALIWDNAPWHVSRAVRGWIRHHNRQVKAEGGCRLLVCRLPSKSPPDYPSHASGSGPANPWLPSSLSVASAMPVHGIDTVPRRQSGRNVAHKPVVANASDG